MTAAWRLLVWGASGAIGGTVVEHALARGWHVVAVSRTARHGSAAEGVEWISCDPLGDQSQRAAFEGQKPFDGVCFAQGANLTDSPATFDIASHLDLYRANCLSVLAALALLVEEDLLRPTGGRIVVVSSIWQERARANKLSYTVTKAAIGGLVRSASVDLGADGHLINGVLPGVLDTPMTRSQLSAEQIARVRNKTTLGRLPELATLADTILYLCSKQNRSVSGQSLAVDLGMSNANLL